MDVLNPELVWIGQRCYRVTVPIEKGSKYERHSWRRNYEEDCGADDDDAGWECEAQVDENQEDLGIEEITGKRKFQLKMHCPQVFHSHVIGVKGSTKKRMEQENSVEILVPKMGSNDKMIIVSSTNKQNIMNARNQIQSIIASGRSKQVITHFTSVKCTTDEIKANFVKFRESIMQDQNQGLDVKLFQKPEKLHFTLEVVVLLDEIDRTLATSVLNECKSVVIDPILNGQPLRLTVAGLNTFNDDPSAVNVLYANVESEYLQQIADGIADLYQKRGLAKSVRDKVRLHMTLMNTRFLSDHQDESSGQRRQKNFKKSTFDARDIMINFKDFHFGTVDVREIHLSQCKSYGEDGFYKSTATIQL